MAVPAVDGALTRLRTQATDRLAADWRGLSGGGKAAVVTSLATIGGGALAGALASPDSRSFLLDQLNGRDLPVPGVDGLSVSLSTQRDNLGVMFTLTSVVTCRSLWASDSCVRFGVGSREVARKDATFAPLAAQTDGAGTVFAETILLSGFSTDEGLRVRRCR
jgi:hypothetical protein